MSVMPKTKWLTGAPLDPALQEKLRALIHEHGAARVAELLGMNQVSITRAASGAGIRDVTAIAIGAKLAEMEQKK